MLLFKGASRKVRSSLLLVSVLATSGMAYADVTLQLEFEELKDSSGAASTSNTLWAIIVAPPGSDLPGGLGQDSSLTTEDIAKARADFGGANITTGASLGDAVVMETGQLSSDGIMNVNVTWTDEDYNTIQAGGLIGLYWFPGITGSSAVLPESNYQIGGLQETTPDAGSGGDAGMIVPSNPALALTIAYFDDVITSGALMLPVSRFTAIDIPPSGYQIWRDLEFTPTQIALGEGKPDADPDGDKLLNLLEYATSTDPLGASINPLTLSRAGSNIDLKFNRIADTELLYRIEATPDLTASPWPDVVFESSGIGNIEELVTHPEALTPGERFFRLSVYFNL